MIVLMQENFNFGWLAEFFSKMNDRWAKATIKNDWRVSCEQKVRKEEKIFDSQHFEQTNFCGFRLIYLVF
jgi:hypothetical protein